MGDIKKQIAELANVNVDDVRVSKRAETAKGIVYDVAVGDKVDCIIADSVESALDTFFKALSKEANSNNN
jgi:hypothetical protein